MNKSKEHITRVVVSVCNQTIELLDIEMGSSREGEYTVNCEGGYKMSVLFKSGKTIERELGYTTTGFDITHEFDVQDTQVELVNTAVDSSK